MKVQLFDIIFDDPQAVFRSGQVISCRIHLKLAEPVKCRALFVKFYGNSLVRWTEEQRTGSGRDERVQSRTYTSEEVYINQTVAVFSPETSGSSAEHHPAGEFIYPVIFQLPPTAPSSFEGGIGCIRYYVKASIDRPWKFDACTKKYFTVIRELDLNHLSPDAVGPFSTSGEYNVNFCDCCNCDLGKVRVNVALPKRGFVPGEQVHVTGEIHNTSSTDLLSINLEIYQRCTFLAEGSRNGSTRVASSVQIPGIELGQSLTLNHLLPVNSLPSSYLAGCDNIYMQYFLRLTGSGGSCLSVQQECCELVIGTVPLRSGMSWGLPLTPLPPMSTPDGATYQTAQPQSATALPPPPSYEECVFGRVDLAKDDGRSFGPQQHQVPWAPRYPVYHGPQG